MDIINPLGKNLIKVETEFCGQPFSLEINRLAFRSKAAVLARHGETVVLATVNVGKPQAHMDYFPLTVDYEERFYAAGKISGSRYIKREGRPSEDAILTGRLIDRPIRPLFPKGYRNEIQAVAIVLSLNPAIRPDAVAMTAISSALLLSGVPFSGPVAGIRVGKTDQFVLCPDEKQRAKSQLDIMVASNEQGIMMVEAGANQVKEQDIVEALDQAHKANQTLIALQKELVAKAPVKAQEYELALPSKEVKDAVSAWLNQQPQTFITGEYAQRSKALEELKESFVTHFEGETEDWEQEANRYLEVFEQLIDQGVRDYIVKNEKRPDGRALDQVRSLSSQVACLPQVHGSAIFTRGATQALNIVTLAPLSFSQVLDTMEKDEQKRYFHHYNAPGYTLGETRRMGSPGRREIGHSALAERALVAVMPDEGSFPYSIRSVTEIMSQHGSTSMAATCSSTLALMDAGVPLLAPVSGVAMGLMIKEDGQPLILTDLQDAEDFAGDMDFKVAGTAEGITALQMDMKVPGLPVEILAKALEAAKTGRATILEHMLNILPGPRENISPNAPQVISIKIPTSKIKDVIGKGGETIQSIIAQTGAQIDIQDDGQVFIAAQNEAGLLAAKTKIEDLTAQPKVGKVYLDRPVVKVADFGAFVNVLPGKDGMVHVSEIADRRLKSPSEALSVGDRVNVKLIAIDDRDRLSLSIKRANSE